MAGAGGGALSGSCPGLPHVDAPSTPDDAACHTVSIVDTRNEAAARANLRAGLRVRPHQQARRPVSHRVVAVDQPLHRGQQLRHAYYVFMVNGNGRSGASLSDTSHAHGLGPARSVDVLGTEPLISAYQEMVVIWAGHGPRQPHPCCSGAPLSRSPPL